MKRLVLHIFVLLMFVAVNAQVLTPMGSGLPASPEKIATNSENLMVAYTNLSNEIELQQWNGDFWQKLPSPNLPKVETTANGYYQIIDLIAFEGNTYIVTGYKTKLSPNAINRITKWDGELWSEIPSPFVQTSASIDKLFIQNGILKCVGKFSQGPTSFNILKLVGDNWIPEGNSITNLSSDGFNSISYANNQLIATGKFTTPISANVTLAVWDGSAWKAAEYPPFLGQNISLGEYGNTTVVYGKSKFSAEAVKRNVKGVWQDMSQGLENYTIGNIAQFAEVNQHLFAVGNFVNKASNKASNLMVYDGTSWSETNLNLSEIEQLHTWKNSVLISGDFSDNARLNGIGQVLLDKALIVARVYNDLNSNCIKDSNEPWMANYPLTSSKYSGDLITDINGQLYLPTELELHNINAATYNYYEPTCPDAEVAATEYKTYYGTALGVKLKSDIYDGAVAAIDDRSYKALNGETRNAHIIVQNIGSLPIINAKVVLNLSAGLGSFTSSKPYDSYENGLVTYTITVGAGLRSDFDVSFLIEDEKNARIDAQLKLNDAQKDDDLSNNSVELNYQIGATQYNYKNCGNGKIISPATTTLSYKIGFKNYNDRSVLAVKIVDEFDSDVTIKGKVNTITSSSEINVVNEWEIIDNRHKVITTLTGLNLTPSGSDNTNSNGFVEYHLDLLPNSLIKGMDICNTAKIYFGFSDGTFDEAMITNTVCTDVADVLGIINNTHAPSYLNDLNIGPNPASNFVSFENNSTKKYHIAVVNALGQELNTIQLNSYAKTVLDIKHLDAGVYTIYVDGIFAKKLILTR
jgi:hypothetical protein